MIGLNVGSGQRPFGEIGKLIPRYSFVPHRGSGPETAWVNIDINPNWNPDIVADCNNLSMFKDESVDQVILWHVIEHFGCGDADSVIKESFRVLHNGGSLIVATPDLRALAERWLKGEIDDFIYTVNLMGAWMGDEADRHKWNWSQEGLLKYIECLAPWACVAPFSGPTPIGTDICVDWWMATAEAVK